MPKPDLKRARALATERGFDPARVEAQDVAFVGAGGYFDQAAADHVCGFVRCLPHTKGKWRGQPFNLLPWQRSFLERLFGWRRADGTRRYRRALLFIAKKNGKTELCAAIALYLLLADGEQAAEVYLGARDRWQASILFEIAATMVRLRPALRKRIEVIPSRKVLALPGEGARLEALSADVDKTEGVNASALILDELHVVSRKLVSAVRYAGAARTQPLMLALTTAGVQEPGAVGWEWYEHACHVRDGVAVDDEFLPAIYEAPASLPWDSDEAVKAANPSLGETVAIEEFRSAVQAARGSASERLDYERYRLNRWVSQAQAFVDLPTWDASEGHPIEESDYEGVAAWGGLDLAATSDLNALAWVFPCQHGDPEAVDVVCRAWVPEGALAKARNAAAYRQWAESGHLTLTPGPVANYGVIRERILADAGRWSVDSLGIDRLFQGLELATALEDEGLAVFPVGMGFTSMGPLVAEFERLILAGRLHHGGNPVLRAAVANLQVRVDPAGNRKPSRESPTRKIDPAVAVLLALDRYLRRQQAEEYDEWDGSFTFIPY